MRISLHALAILLGTACHPTTPLDEARLAQILEIEGDAQAGEPVYEENCQACHGAEATGTLRGVDIAGYDVETIVEKVLTGPNHMPTFDHLEDEAIADLAAYINSLPPV